MTYPVSLLDHVRISVHPPDKITGAVRITMRYYYTELDGAPQRLLMTEFLSALKSDGDPPWDLFLDRMFRRLWREIDRIGCWAPAAPIHPLAIPQSRSSTL